MRSIFLAALLAYVPNVGAQVSFVTSTTNQQTATSITLQIPGAATAGDVLITAISMRGGSAQNINTPAGWTLARRDNNGTNIAQAIYWRAAQIGDAGNNVTWSGWSSQETVAAMLVYRGADVSLGAPIDVSGGQAINGNLITAPSVSVSTVDPLLVLVFGQAAGNRTITSPAGTSVRVNDLEEAGTGNGVTMEVADIGFVGAGATPAYTANVDRIDNNIGQVIAIKPAPIVAGPYAWYQMEELSWTGAAGEVADASGNGRNGTRTGSAQTIPDGQVCRGANIPANSSAAVIEGIDSGFDINNVGDRGTISLWYRASSNWNSGTPRMLFDASTGSGAPDKYFYGVLLGNGVLRFGAEDNSDTDFQVDSPAQAFVAGTWVHVAVSWQFNSLPNNRMRVYVNGTLAGQSVVSNQSLGATLGNLIIGDNSSNYFVNGSTPNSANGDIDEVRVYNFEQTAAEIQTDRDATHPCGGPVAEYRLDEVSWNGTAGEVQDSSGNGLHGVARGSATPVPAQVCNGAQMNFPPGPQTGYIEIPDDPLLDITTALTVTAWINPVSYPPNGLMSIASKDTNWEFHLTPTGQVNWWWNTGAAQLFTGAGVVPLNTWTHVAITFRQGQQVIYINGAPAASGTDAAALFTNNLPLHIGDDQLFGGGSRRFRGTIDEVRVYDRTLAQADVVQVMNETRPCPSTVDHYRVQNPASGINCQPENITITAHDSLHNPVSASARTITITAARVAGAAGTHGDFALVTGTGTFNNGVADDGVATYTFGAGESSVTLSFRDTWVQTVNISVSDGTVTDISGTANVDVGYDQNLSFSAAGFRFVDAGNSVIPTQVAGVNSGPFFLQAIETAACVSPGPCAGVCTVPGAFVNGGGVNVDLAFRCDNPVTCQPGQQVQVTNNGATLIASNPATGVSSWTTKNLLFGANGMAAFDLLYPDVGAISLHARYNLPLGNGNPSGNMMTGSSNGFVVRPFDFVVESAAPNEIKRTADGFANPAAASATDPMFIRAGDNFTVTVTAVNFAGTPTPNYGQETSPETVLLTANLAGGLGLVNNPGLTNPTAFGAFSGGRSTGTTFSWGEVGIITLTPSVGDGDYLGVGNVTGTASANVGRFVPFDFAVARNVPLFDPGCSAAGKDPYTYIGEPFFYQTDPVITVTARNRAGVTTQNYSGSFFRINAASLSGKTYSAAVGALDISGLPGVDPVIRFNGDGLPSAPAPGNGTLTIGAGTGLTFVRTTPIVTFDADISLSINVMDLDATTVALIDGIAGSNPVRFGQATTGNGILFAGTTVTPGKTPREMRFGRLRMQNAIGSTRLPLPLRVSSQYYTANGFVTNADDNCTTFDAGDAAMAFVAGTNLTACETATTPGGTITLSDGLASGLRLAAPGVGNDGGVDVTLNLAAATGSTCTAVGAAVSAASFTPLHFLRGNWGGSASWDQDPRARATFGIYNNAAEFLYLQENY